MKRRGGNEGMSGVLVLVSSLSLSVSPSVSLFRLSIDLRKVFLCVHSLLEAHIKNEGERGIDFCV